ncbi:hypothetical protein R75461_07907 [Paraburkholderia nemoris]|nr:hypothetical protein R75461_07907 [Paraburkholderia nemoris]
MHRGTHRLIEVTLSPFEFDGAHDHGFRRQLGGDLVLAPAQHEGADAPRKQLASHGVAAVFDGGAPAPGEILTGTEETGQQEVELRPQIAEVIFKWRAGQAQAVARAQRRAAQSA